MPGVRLATFYLEQRSPASAVPHLEKALELLPDRADLIWLLGRAQLLAGRPAAGARLFRSSGRDWWRGAAVGAQRVGQRSSADRPAEDALDRFNTTLAADPGNPQALFYSGLVLEGLGRVQEAVDHYCRSLEGGPNRPTEERLQTLGRSCG